MLTEASATATKPMIWLKLKSAGPAAISAPTMMTEEMRVGDRHQRRMQRRRHPPDHVVADEAGQHEHGEQENEGRVGDAFGHLPSGFRDGGFHGALSLTP